MTIGLAAAGLGLAACSGSTSSAATAAHTPAGQDSTAAAGGIAPNIGKDDKANLTGAGATFPAPVYQAWFDQYNNDVAKGVKINYQAIGSGGGIQQFTSGTVDFGASDAPMTDGELKAAPGTQHIPMVLGSVVITYNLDGLSQPLKIDGDTVARIYLGEIKKWNDPAIANQNAGAKLPDKDIIVAYRSDGSGTSFVFTDWLTKVSAGWKAKVGASKNPSWPAGQGGKGNDGVTALVRQTPNAIGYVELNYALANKLAYADVKNNAGKYVTPSIAATSHAAAGVELPADYRVSITNPAGDAAYPVSSFTYLLVHSDSKNCSVQQPLVHFLWWVFHDPAAAKTASGLNYAPLPQSLLPKLETTLKSLTCEGKPVLP